MLNQRVKVSSGTYLAPPIVNVVQNDTGRVLILEPFDYVITGNETATLICRRPSGSIYTYSGTVNALDNDVSVPLDGDGGALTQVGDVAAELILTASGDTITSFMITLRVQPDISGEATPEEVTFVAQLQAQVDAAFADYQAALNAVAAQLSDYVPKTRKVNNKALSSDITLNASDVSAVPDTRTVNNKALSQNIALAATDVGAVPDTRTVNGQVLSTDATINASNIPYTPHGALVSTEAQGAIDELYDMIVIGNETEIYTGSTTAITTGSYPLDDDVTNYQYLDFWIGYNGRVEIHRVPVRENISFSFRIPNISDSTSTLLYVSELSLSFAGSVLTVTNVGAWQQGNGSTYNPTKSSAGAIYIEKILGIKYDAIGSGGGGGTSNYNDLTNKPSIGGVTLSGNKDIDDLGGIPLPSSPSSGDFLVYDGADWTAMALTTWSGGNY